MKTYKNPRSAFVAGLLAVLVTLSVHMPNATFASGGSSSGGGGGTVSSSVDTIKVSKCYYADVGAYVELLINASSSNTSAHLYAYLPDGTYLGEVQNGGGGRYGGTVFLSLYIPDSITIISSAGGNIVSPTVPFQF